MKKTLLILVVLLSSVSVFAAHNSFNLSVSPYTVQFTTSTYPDYKTQISTYGVGAEFTYRRAIAYGIFGEAGFGWDYFVYPNKQYKNYNNVMFFAGVGYNYTFANKWTVDGHFDVADDVLYYMSKASDSITLRVGSGVAYHFTESLSATFKVDGTFGFAKKDGTYYVRYRVVPMAGCAYSF